MPMIGFCCESESQSGISSSSSSYSFNVRDPKTHTVFQASALARVGPPVIFLQAQRSCAISSFMSLLTQLLHVFLGAPLSTTPITFILVHFFTQSFSSFRSTCPNHLNLPLCILFSTHSMPKRFKSSSLRFLSFLRIMGYKVRSACNLHLQPLLILLNHIWNIDYRAKLFQKYPLNTWIRARN